MPIALIIKASPLVWIRRFLWIAHTVMNNTMKCLYGLLTLVASISSFSLFAASLQVTPVNLFFEKNENAKAVYLSNSGPHDVRAQLRLYLWEQENGKDVLTDARDLVASPPMTQIPPGKTQMVRMLMVQPPPGSRERSWRLIVDELPPAIDSTASSDNHVNFLLRYSIPVFAGGDTSPDISRIHVRLEGNRLWVRNDNPVHIKLSNVRLLKGKQTVTVTAGLMGYVLGGKQMVWPVGAASPGMQKVEFSLNDSPVLKSLPLQ